jgi:hypothetical protein
VSGLGKMISGVGSFIGAIGKMSGAISKAGGLMSWLSSGPVLAAIGAIGVLTAAIIAFSGGTDEAVEKTKELIKSTEESAKAYEASGSDIRAEASAAGILADKLGELSKKENKSTVEKIEMASIVEQLNDIVPELNLAIDEQTGALNMNAEAILNTLEARKQELILEAAQERLLELYKEQIELGEQKTVMYKKVDDAIKKFGKSEEDRAKAIALVDDQFRQSEIDNAAAVTALEGQITGLAQTVAAANQVASSADKIYTQEQAMEYAKRLQEQQKYSQESMAIAEEQKAAQELYNSQAKELTEKHMNEMGGIDDRGIEKSRLTAAQVKKNLDKQIADFNNWRGGIKSLSGKVPEDVQRELEKLGPGYDKVIDGLNKMAKDDPKGLKAWVKTFQDKSALAKDAAVNGLDGLADDTSSAAYNAGQAYADALASKAKEAAASGEKIADSTYMSISPIVGSMRNVGEYAGLGFKNGILSKIGAVRDASAQLAAAVEKTITVKLSISSPSKILRALGKFVPEGLALGITDNLNSVRQAVATMANVAIPRLSMPSVSSMRPVQAAAGGYYAGNGGQAARSINITVNAPGPYYVRSDADIKAIGQAQAREVSKVLRAQGVS